MRRIALIAFLAVFTAACSTAYRSDVTRFHKLPEPQGETVFITSSDAAKVGSLEFAQYAGLLVPRLQSLGYKVVTDPKADLVVEMDYEVTQSEQRYYISGGYPYYHYPFYSAYGYGFGHLGFGHHGFGHHGFGHHGFGHHGFGHYGYGYSFYPRETYIRTIYITRLAMKIRRGGGELLFEGNALTDDYKGHLSEIMPYLVDAMFTNFPGESGSTEVVKLERSDYGQS